MDPFEKSQNPGKRIPYETPDKFFDKFPEKVLFAAKQRERKARLQIYLWRPVAVAASLVLFALIGYFITRTNKLIESHPVVQKTHMEELKPIAKGEVSQQSELAQVKEAIPDKEAELVVEKTDSTEKIDEILAGLTDDELYQLAARIKTDPFTAEAD